MILLIPAGYASASDAGSSGLRKKALWILAGATVGLALHEAGHFAAESFLGWEEALAEAEALNVNKRRNVSLAGFATDVVVSNIIMSTKKIPKGNAFVLGMLAYELLRPPVYIAQHEIEGHGDLATYESTGGDVLSVEIGLIINSAFNLYRLYKDPGFELFVRTTKEETSILMKWKF